MGPSSHVTRASLGAHAGAAPACRGAVLAPAGPSGVATLRGAARVRQTETRPNQTRGAVSWRAATDARYRSRHGNVERAASLLPGCGRSVRIPQTACAPGRAQSRTHSSWCCQAPWRQGRTTSRSQFRRRGGQARRGGGGGEYNTHPQTTRRPVSHPTPRPPPPPPPPPPPRPPPPPPPRPGPPEYNTHAQTTRSHVSLPSRRLSSVDTCRWPRRPSRCRAGTQ
jgi:hypothetical protein